MGLRCLVAYLFGVAACFVLGLATSVGWVWCCGWVDS